MLDPTMLMLMGLMDHPIIIESEKARIRDIKHKKMIKEMVKKCMENESLREALDIDPDLAELFVAAEISERSK